jgi:hypothetical protein
MKQYNVMTPFWLIPRKPPFTPDTSVLSLGTVDYTIDYLLSLNMS